MPPSAPPDTRPCPACACPLATLTLTEQDFRIVRCRRCRLVYLANPPDDTRFYDDYHQSADTYRAEDYRHDSPNRALAELWHINQQRAQTLIRHKPAGTLLDIGCGRGFFLHTAAASGYTVEGIDISKIACDFTADSFDVAASTNTLDDLIKQGRHYDCITLWHVLEHFLDPCAELRKIHTLLAPDGICVIEVPNFNSLPSRLSKHPWQGGNHPKYHRTFFTPQTLAMILRQSGFSATRRVPLNYRLPDRSAAAETAKRLLNTIARDSFLDFIAQR